MSDKIPYVLAGAVIAAVTMNALGMLKEETTIVDKLKFWKGTDEKTDPSKQYRIKVVETENGGTRVNVVDAEGNRNRSSTANRIVSLLYEQLK